MIVYPTTDAATLCADCGAPAPCTLNGVRLCHRCAARRALGDGYQEAPDCPICGAAMMRRDGQRGEFWGCSEYPVCKGTRPIEAARVTTGDKNGRRGQEIARALVTE